MEHMDQATSELATKADLMELKAELKTEFKAELAAQSAAFQQHLVHSIEQLETRLLTTFHNWASPVDMRIRKVEGNESVGDARLAMIEGCLYELERRRP